MKDVTNTVGSLFSIVYCLNVALTTAKLWTVFLKTCLANSEVSASCVRGKTGMCRSPEFLVWRCHRPGLGTWQWCHVLGRPPALGQRVEQGRRGRLGDRLGDVLRLQQHHSVKSASCNLGEDGRYHRAMTSLHTRRVEGDFSPPTSLCLRYRRDYL